MPAVLDSLRSNVGELHLQSGYGDRLSDEFLRGEIDILISTDRLDGLPRIQCLRLCTERLVAMVPAGVRPERLSVPALSDQLPFVRCTKSSPLAAMVEEYLSGQEFVPPHRIECNATSSMLEMVKTGLAWTILPPLCISHTAFENGKIAFLELPAPAKTRSIYLISATDALLDLPRQIAEQARQALDRLTKSWLTQEGCHALADAVRIESAPFQDATRKQALHF
jgi:DNA-binding transcriptional LysR family regulator